MKIGFVATEVGKQEGGAYMGGNVNNIITLSQALAERGHEVTIITTTPRDPAPDPTGDITWANVYEYTPRFDHGTPGYFASFCTYAVRKIKKLWQAGELDVVTIHAGFSLWGLIGRALALRTDCPAVHVQYCPVGQPSGSRLYDTLQQPWFSRKYLSGADELVGVSPVVSRSLEEVTGRSSVQTILPTIDTERYAPFPKTEKLDTCTISYLGSLKEQKGLDLLVEAFERLRENYDCRLQLGLEVRSERKDSPLTHKIQSNPDIDVSGIVDDVPKFLAQSHVFAVPFRTTMGPADYPVAALEALSCGVPLVATDVGGLQQLIDDSDGGICAGEPETDNLRAGLSRIFKNEELRTELGENGAEYIRRSCSVQVVSDIFMDVLRPLVSEQG